MKIAQPSVDLFVGGVLHVLKPNEDPTEGTITSIKFTEHTMLVTLAEDPEPYVLDMSATTLVQLTPLVMIMGVNEAIVTMFSLSTKGAFFSF